MDDDRELLDLWVSGVCKGSAAIAAPVLVAEIRRLREERERLLSLLVDKGSQSPPLWYALLPDNFARLGMSWHECETRAEAEAKVLEAAKGVPAAAGLGGERGE